MSLFKNGKHEAEPQVLRDYPQTISLPPCLVPGRPPGLCTVSSYKRVQSENVGHCLVFVYIFNKIGMLNVSYGICDVSIHLLADVYIFLTH